MLHVMHRLQSKGWQKCKFAVHGLMIFLQQISKLQRPDTNRKKKGGTLCTNTTLASKPSDQKIAL